MLSRLVHSKSCSHRRGSLNVPINSRGDSGGRKYTGHKDQPYVDITSPELIHLSGSDNDISHSQLQVLIYFTEQLNWEGSHTIKITKLASWHFQVEMDILDQWFSRPLPKPKWNRICEDWAQVPVPRFSASAVLSWWALTFENYCCGSLITYYSECSPRLAASASAANWL